MSDVRPLRHLAGVRVSNVDKKSVEGQRPVRLCNYTDVYYGDRITPELDLMAATATAEQVRAFGLRRGDVLITKDSEDASDIGVPAFVAETAPDLVCGYHLAVLRPAPGRVDGRYLYWAMLSRPVQEHLSVSATGITRYGLRTDSISATPIPWWPLDEQRAIAAYLDTETTRIDALIAKKRRMVDLLNEREHSLVDAVFGLGDERVVRLGRVARLQTGLTLDSNRTVDGESVIAPYLRVANVQPGWLSLTEVKEVIVPKAVAIRCLLRPGDVLMTEGGDLDKLGRGTVWRGEIKGCLHQNHVFAVRPDRSLLLPDYLAMFTRTSHARRYFESTGTRSTNLASTNSSKVLDLRVPVLPVDEQQLRLQTYNSTATVIDQGRQLLIKQIDLLVEHRQALITAAVTGELSVPGVAA